MKSVKNFIIAFLISSKKPALYSFITSCLLIGALYVPLLNIPVIFATYPLFWIIPDFSQDGLHVGWGFFGLVLKSPTAFLVFFTYYFFVSFLLIFSLKDNDVVPPV